MVSMKVREQFVKYERCGHLMQFVLKSSNVLESEVHTDCCWQWLAVILLLLLPCVTSQWSYRHKDTAVDLDSAEVASVAPNGSANYILDWMSKLGAFSGTNVRLKNNYLLLAFQCTVSCIPQHIDMMKHQYVHSLSTLSYVVFAISRWQKKKGIREKTSCNLCKY